MQIFHLRADKPLTKTFTKIDGRIEKTSYLHALNFTSYLDELTTIEQFFDTTKQRADEGCCLIKGMLSRPLTEEPRAGTTNTDDPTEWICLDFDGLPPEYSPHQLLEQLGIADVSYVLQWSASQNITNADLRFHIFMLLDRPTAAPLLKQWLIHLNHTVPFLRKNQRLQPSHNGLSWGLDITTCQNDKLIYTAPPNLVGLRNPLGRKPRYELVKSKHAKLTLPKNIATAEINRQLTEARINELRIAAGMPERKFNYKLHKNTQVLAKPGEATITGQKNERGFVYFNLNGGDSWAYYHPETDPEIIYSFKGDMAYRTSELLPDYWKEAQGHATKLKRAASTGAYVTHDSELIYLAFQDKRQSRYWRGTYDAVNDTLDLNKVNSEKQVRDFCMQHSVPMGDYIPIWDKFFDPNPSLALRVDPDAKTVNMFQPTEYMRAFELPATKQAKLLTSRCPPTIYKLIHHALGSDEKITEHYLNWLAFIIQNRTRTGTAWLFWGTEGTGKGQWFERVLQPLFGTNAHTARVDELLGTHNGFLADKLILAFDEVHISVLKDPELLMAKLRNIITERTIPIRSMYTESTNMENWCNCHLFSNKTDAVVLNKGDRRYNIGRWQDKKLEISREELEEIIPSELQTFYNYMMLRQADEAVARTPMESEDRDNLIATTMKSADVLADAIRSGDLDYFLLEDDSEDRFTGNSLKLHRAEDYRHTLVNVLNRVMSDGASNISRDELFVLFDFVVGDVKDFKTRFAQYLKRHQLYIKPMSINQKSVRGLRIQWKDPKQIPAAIERLRGPKPEAPKAKIIPINIRRA